MKTDEKALHIIEELKKHGFIAYYAGGCVRDFLLGHASEDIDIATDAPPEAIRKIFPHTVPVGIAFGILIVIIDNRQYEVATFRKETHHISGRYPEKIEFTSAEMDAIRRDFTINGLFYDPKTDKIHDFVNGQKDLRNKIIRAIGNPEERFFEDRLRMVRAARFAARFGFEIEIKTWEAIQKYAKELFPAVSIERIWHEITKMAQKKHFKTALHLLFESGLFKVIFPELKDLGAKEFEKRIRHIEKFSAKMPVIIRILELFENFPLQGRLQLGRRLKLSNYDLKVIEYIGMVQDGNDYYWAKTYANEFFDLYLEAASIRLGAQEKEFFLKKHHQKQQLLAPQILRLKEKRPLVTSQMLQTIGIRPGKQMGNLLQIAEEIAACRHLDDAAAVLEILKKELSPTTP